MAIINEQTSIWEEIDRVENYLVCCMFEEAAPLASSILERLLVKIKDCEVSENLENQWGEMVESAGMVFVQSLKQLGRTPEILKELKLLFGSLNGIPVQVFVTGVCFQMSENLSTIVQGFLEEFLNTWIYVDDRYYPLPGAVVGEGSPSKFSIEVDEYLEVVELYAITLLSTTLKDTDLAISWVEKATLPMDKQQELLRRLRSMNSSNVTSSYQTSISSQRADEFPGDQNSCLQNDIGSKSLSSGVNITAKEELLKLSRQNVPCFWWFRTIRLNLGNTELVIPTGKLLMASLLLLMYFFTRKKQAVLKRFLVEKAVSIKKALLDLWQLAFSYQVNPLAAVQTLPTANLGSH